MSFTDLVRYMIAVHSVIEPATKIMYIFMMLSAIAFPIVGGILAKNGKNLKIWIICSFVPLVLCIVHLLFHIYGNSLETTFNMYLTMYLMSLLFPLFVLLRNKKILFRIKAVLLSIVIFLGTYYSLSFEIGRRPGIRNFSHQSYTQAYLSTIDCLKEIYVNSDWKAIDYDAINAEVYPLVETAERENDKVKFLAAMQTLAYYLYDGHVHVDTNDYEVDEQSTELMCGNDYGFILFRLADGKTKAFDVDEDSEAYKNGIKSGTTVISWDNVPIDEAINNLKVINGFGLSFPVAENEDFLKPLFLAGKGGDTVKVGFIDENGKEKTAVVSKRGRYLERLQNATTHRYHIYYSDITNPFADNFSTKMLNDEVGCLKITDETFDDWLETKAMITGEFPEMTEMLTQKITDLKRQGMKKLVIDLRNNAGGDLDIVIAIVSLFTDSREIVNYWGGTRKMAIKVPTYLYGTGTFKDMPVFVLVNSNTYSAGDDMADYLRKLDNVTLAGMTCSNNASQPIGGLCVLPDDVWFYFPSFISLNANGDVQGDTKADRIARIPVDIKIPVDEELAHKIFETDEDAEMNYLLEHYIK